MEPYETSPEEKTWALAAHLTSLSWFVGVPGFIGPLIIWLIKKDTMPFATAQAKESLNFQISLFIYATVCAISMITIILIPFAIIASIVLLIMELVYTITATMRTSEGKHYQYPFTLRLVS